MKDGFWENLLRSLREISPSVEMLLRSCKFLSIDEKKLRLGVFYKFHKESIEDLRNRTILEDILTKICSKKVFVECILCEQPKAEISDYNLVEPKIDISVEAEKIFN